MNPRTASRCVASFALTLATGLVGMGSSSDAATVYRCGDRYAERPCPGGRPVDVSDDRSPAQRAEASRLASAERRSALVAEQERRAREQATARTGAGRLDRPPASAAAPVPAPLARKKRHPGGRLDRDDFLATGARVGGR